MQNSNDYENINLKLKDTRFFFFLGKVLTLFYIKKKKKKEEVKEVFREKRQ